MRLLQKGVCYNIDLLKQDESSKLNEFTSNCGLTIPNFSRLSPVTDENISLIDQCLVSNNQINYVNSHQVPFNTDYYMLSYETLISCRPKIHIIQIEARKFQNFHRERLNLDLALSDWPETYKKTSGSEMFEVHGIIVKKIISERAPYCTKP